MRPRKVFNLKRGELKKTLKVAFLSFHPGPGPGAVGRVVGVPILRNRGSRRDRGTVQNFGRIEKRKQAAEIETVWLIFFS